MDKRILYLLGAILIAGLLYFVVKQNKKSSVSVKPLPGINKTPSAILPDMPIPDMPIPDMPISDMPIPGISPGIQPPGTSILQQIVKGAPIGADTTETINSAQAAFVKDCVSGKGVVNIDQKSTMLCLKYLDGTVMNKYGQPITVTQVNQYLSALYPGVNFNTLDFTPFYNALEFKYNAETGEANGTIKRVAPVEAPIFYNLEYVEVIPIVSNYFNALERFLWNGTWYLMGTGTGWFMKTKPCLFAYNSIHLLNLFDISDTNFLNFSSPEFKTFAGSQTTSTIRQQANSPNAKIPYLSDQGKTYIAQLAVQRGYRCIQLSNEWDGEKYERYFIDLIETLFSIQKCIQKNPFSVKTNPNTENLWLDVFFAPGIPLVDSKYIIDTDPPKTLGQRYGDFAFKSKCSKQRGAINIADMLLTCQKIIRFGGAVNLLDTETSDIDWKSMPQSTELEKLQSYFTAVYGSPEVWKSKDLTTLQDYWNRMEMRYKLPIFPTSPYKQYSKQLNFGNQSFGTQMIAYQEDGRPGEAVKYIEVVRQNLKNSYYETTDIFNGCYYYACRGSGLFLPVGKLMVSKTKQSTAQTWGTVIPPGGIPEDIEIAKFSTYRGYDTLLLVRYCGYTCPPSVEVLSLKDPITSLNSLIRTHPWDPMLNEVADYDLTDAYSGSVGVDVKNCLITKQYQPGTGGNICPL